MIAATDADACPSDQPGDLVHRRGVARFPRQNELLDPLRGEVLVLRPGRPPKGGSGDAKRLVHLRARPPFRAEPPPLSQQVPAAL